MLGLLRRCACADALSVATQPSVVFDVFVCVSRYTEALYRELGRNLAYAFADYYKARPTLRSRHALRSSAPRQAASAVPSVNLIHRPL